MSRFTNVARVRASRPNRSRISSTAPSTEFHSALENDTSQLVQRAEEISASIEESKTDAIAADEAAEKALAEGETLRAHADRSQFLADRGNVRPMTATMVEIGEAIDTARQQAEAAVLSGGDNAVGAWVEYRLEASRLIGVWRAVSDRYQSLFGRQAPPGPTYRHR